MITVRYFAGARAAAGVPEDVVSCHTLDDLVGVLVSRRGERLGSVLGAASFLVDGVSWRDRARPLPERATVDVLPPFAGG